MNDPFVSVIIPTHNRKEMLIRLINSVIKSNYPDNMLEIIVIDDASTDGTYNDISNRYPNVRLIRNDRKKLVSESRNIGIKNSVGDNVFLVDDDNIIDQDCIPKLVAFIKSNPSVGVAAPMMFYLEERNRIWCAGIKRNYYTSATKAIGRDQIDKGQYSRPLESEDFPNAFMVKSAIFKRVGLFDSFNFPMMYEEADFCKRVLNAGYKIYCVPQARIWHDIKCHGSRDFKRRYHVQDEERSYYMGRNRVLFHRRYGTTLQSGVFLAIFLPLMTAYYLFGILRSSVDYKLAGAYLRGVIEGLIRSRPSKKWLSYSVK